MNRNMLIVVLAAGAVAVLTIGLVAAPNLQTAPRVEDSTRVEAPFTSVETSDEKTRVRAPFVDIEVPKDKTDPAK
jgi:hypothetical protein